MDKLNIANEMRQLDQKNRKFYEELTDEERKKFSNFLMIRWSSSIEGDSELQKYYIRSCNYYLNRHFFSINRHPKLQWLCATAVSPGLGSQRHNWIKPKKKETAKNPIRRRLGELYPNWKDNDLDLLASITTKQEFDQLMREHGEE